MKTYIGSIHAKNGHVIHVHTEGAARRLLQPRYDLRNHSPDGFCWGYAGSGPAQAALAILADHFRDDRRAMALYQAFKFDCIARLDRLAGFTLTSAQVDEVVRKIETREPAHE